MATMPAVNVAVNTERLEAVLGIIGKHAVALADELAASREAERQDVPLVSWTPSDYDG